MQALVTAKVSIEHEYMSLLCSIDGLRHPLLEYIPSVRDEETTEYKISRKEFLDKRLSFAQREIISHFGVSFAETDGLTGVIANLTHHLSTHDGHEPKTVVIREKCVGSVLTLLSTMQNIYQVSAITRLIRCVMSMLTAD